MAVTWINRAVSGMKGMKQSVFVLRFGRPSLNFLLRSSLGVASFAALSAPGPHFTGGAGGCV